MMHTRLSLTLPNSRAESASRISFPQMPLTPRRLSSVGNAAGHEVCSEPPSPEKGQKGHTKHIVCIIFVAGHGNRLEREIEADESSDLAHLRSVPKALLPANSGRGAKALLTHWWETVREGQLFRDVFLVTNADKYKFYERWATANEFPVANIINDGTTTCAARLGALGDFDLVLRSKNITSDVLVVAGDTLFSAGFDIHGVIRFFRSRDGELATCYELSEFDDATKLGLMEIDDTTRRVTAFIEKPTADEANAYPSRQGHIVFSAFRPCSFQLLQEYLEKHPDPNERSFGLYMQWLVERTPVYGMRIPGGFQLTGDIGLLEYQEWITRYEDLSRKPKMGPTTHRAFARVGLLGNPSDGFYGKTISLSVLNFWAQARIVESERLHLVPHALNDPMEFGSMSDLTAISRKEGYLGGLRLMQATCKKFFEYCTNHGIALPRKNFTLSYDTNIPRQVGLAGSSAIVTSVLKCLMAFFGLSARDIPLHIQPSFVLSVETEELHINAGLQDRVIQVYEGMVFMDFERSIVEQCGYGRYTQLRPPLWASLSGDTDTSPASAHVSTSAEPPAAVAAVTAHRRTATTATAAATTTAETASKQSPAVTAFPLLWLAYSPDPSDSGKIHNDVKQRWLQGDKEVVEGMAQFGSFAERGQAAIRDSDWATLGDLMNANFALRRKLYGEAALGSQNLRMKEIAETHSCPAKFPGSGGAVVGLCLDTAVFGKLKRAFESEGFVCIKLHPNAGIAAATVE